MHLRPKKGTAPQIGRDRVTAFGINVPFRFHSSRKAKMLAESAFESLGEGFPNVCVPLSLTSFENDVSFALAPIRN